MKWKSVIYRVQSLIPHIVLSVLGVVFDSYVALQLNSVCKVHSVASRMHHEYDDLAWYCVVFVCIMIG